MNLTGKRKKKKRFRPMGEAGRWWLVDGKDVGKGVNARSGATFGRTKLQKKMKGDEG